MSDLTELRDGMRRFTEERDWGEFHDPKSLALALVGEVGEVAELLQWLPAAEAAALSHGDRLHARCGEELADVLYLVRLADVLEIDLAKVAELKLRDSARRFDVQSSRGTAPERP